MVNQRQSDSDDRTGFDDTTNYLSAAVSRFVPRWLARRAITVDVSTDRTAYDQGEPVDITVTFDNRLPLPVELSTPTRRPWGWAIDGVLEATDEQRYVREESTAVSFRAGETKTTTVTWNGHFRRENAEGLDRSEPAERGDHTVSAFLAVTDRRVHHEDATEIRIR
jgi:hypothetical protein